MTLDFCRSSRMPINISLNVPEDIMLAIAQAGGDVAYAGACRACREYFINHPVLLYNAVKAAAGALTLRHMMELALQHGNSAASAFTIALVREVLRRARDPEADSDFDLESFVLSAVAEDDAVIAELLIHAIKPDALPDALHDAVVCACEERRPRCLRLIFMKMDLNLNMIALMNDQLYTATVRGFDDIVGILLDHGAKTAVDNFKSYYAACSLGFHKIIRRMTDMNLLGAVPADVGDGLGLDMAAEHAHLLAMKALLAAEQAPLRNSRDSSPLMCAVRSGSCTAVDLVLEGDDAADITARNGEALVWAAMRTEKLIRHLLRLSKGSKVLSPGCGDGKALVAASGSGNLQVVKLLLRYGPEVLRADCQEGQALVSACIKGSLEVVSWLLNSSVHPPRADCQLGQALISAAEHGHSRVVSFLLEFPLFPPRPDCRGNEPLRVATDAATRAVLLVAIAAMWPPPGIDWLMAEPPSEDEDEDDG